MGSAHETSAYETFYNTRTLVRQETTDPVDYDVLSSPSANESTSDLQVRTYQRDTGKVTFETSLEAETLAYASLARLAYRHDDVTQMDDLRRT